jgi:GNAT superfamily N-acetyltransferase
MSYTIRHAQSRADFLGKAAVHHQAWQETYAGMLDPDWLASRSIAFSQERALRAAAQNIPTLVALDGERVVGFCDYGPARDADLTSAGEVYALYLLSSHQGQGIGGALMAQAPQELATYPQAVVWTLQANVRAQAFYAHHGFVPDGAEHTLVLGTPVTDIRLIRR